MKLLKIVPKRMIDQTNTLRKKLFKQKRQPLIKEKSKNKLYQVKKTYYDDFLFVFGFCVLGTFCVYTEYYTGFQHMVCMVKKSVKQFLMGSKHIKANE